MEDYYNFSLWIFTFCNQLLQGISLVNIFLDNLENKFYWDFFSKFSFLSIFCSALLFFPYYISTSWCVLQFCVLANTNLPKNYWNLLSKILKFFNEVSSILEGSLLVAIVIFSYSSYDYRENLLVFDWVFLSVFQFFCKKQEWNQKTGWN